LSSTCPIRGASPGNTRAAWWNSGATTNSMKLPCDPGRLVEALSQSGETGRPAALSASPCAKNSASTL
jgi:hypothetical protein